MMGLAKARLNYYYLMTSHVIFKSREQRVITKEHIAMHTNLILPF